MLGWHLGYVGLSTSWQLIKEESGICSIIVVRKEVKSLNLACSQLTLSHSFCAVKVVATKNRITVSAQ